MAKKNSRTTNTIYNFTSSIGGQLITIVMQFVVRTVFINTLGKSYLGINGLFSNILQMLSLAEFGVGSAILFKLYDPLAHEDHHRIAVLMKFYKKVYTVIGIAVAVVGLCLVPFLPVLINDYDKLTGININAALIFCLYLLKSVSSYLFFAYKSAIIKADQKEYLINIISYFFTVAAGIAHIVFLTLWPNFTVYVLIQVAQVIFQNIVCAYLSNRMYPYINEKTDKKLPHSEVKEVFKDCAAIFLYRLNGVVLKATDNIVLSVFLGLDMVAMYSNYYVLYTTINTLFSKIFNAVSHSLGNLHTEEDKKHEYRVFESIMLITAILGGTAGVGLALVSDELVLAWIGPDWVLPQPFAILMGIEVATLAFRVVITKFRTSMGLFQQAMYRPLVGMVINLVVSIMLVKKLGIVGVLIGTVVADWTTMMWYDPMIIHKHGFKGLFPVSVYFIKLLKYVVIVLLVGFADAYLCSVIIPDKGWVSIIAHTIIILMTVPGALMLITCQKPEGKYVVNIVKRYAKKLKKKIAR